MPQKCIDGSLVSSSNAQEAFLVGCEVNPEKIYKLRWSNDETTLEWVLMRQTLKYPKSNVVAMLIPDSLTHCKTNIRTTTITTSITTPTATSTTIPTTIPTSKPTSMPTTTPTTTCATISTNIYKETGQCHPRTIQKKEV